MKSPKKPASADKNENIRHSLAHLLAAAVRALYPGAMNAIGPAIENGFYQDFELPKPISEDDLPKIEAKMRELLPGWTKWTKKVVTLKDVKKEFSWNRYKMELAKEFARDKKTLTFYTCGGLVDLCKGGHASALSEIDPESFKLERVAGAYWRGDEKNKMLTRIYGLAFENKKELEEYLKNQKEAERRDHRKLGKELGLFTLADEVGPGLPLFYPKGAILRRTVENFIQELQEKNGYEPIWIPHVAKEELYKISGHLGKYDAMYPLMRLKGEADYYLKPMNCPHFMMLYKSEPHSYRELPVRYTSTTTVYRREKSGELSGLARVRALTQDDCHVFARPDQIEEEMDLMLDMVAEVYRAFGFNNFRLRLSAHDTKHPEKYIGEPKIWRDSEAILAKLIKKHGWDYEVGEGEATFYGPKIDFILKDVLGREWQLSTIQLDMNLPKRFGLEYADKDGRKKEPIVIHRAILGSTERFLAILIEHFAGAFPFWLAPLQVTILTINEKVETYAEEILKELKSKDIRAELDSRNESISKKIREAELQKIPYLLIIGEKEAAAKKIAVRERGQGDLGQKTLEEFLKIAK